MVERRDGAHLAGEFTHVVGEEPFVLPVEARRPEEALAIEIGADTGLYALDEIHEDEGAFRGRQSRKECGDVAALSFITDEGVAGRMAFLVNAPPGACLKFTDCLVGTS